jgi:hypothetical protein
VSVVPVDGVFDVRSNTYTTGMGETVYNIHSPELCDGRPCIVHNPSKHSMRAFPTHWRPDRRIMERICPHGVGHPDPDEIDPDTVHGCDGCCAPLAQRMGRHLDP